MRAYCSAASLKVHRILCPTSQNNTYTYICMCMYIHTYLCICTYMCKCCAVTMLFALFLYTLEGILVFSISSCYLRTYYLVPPTPLLCTLLDSIRTTDMDQLRTYKYTYTCVAVHIRTQGCAQSVYSVGFPLPPSSLKSVIANSLQLLSWSEQTVLARRTANSAGTCRRPSRPWLSAQTTMRLDTCVRTYIHTYIHTSGSVMLHCMQSMPEWMQ